MHVQHGRQCHWNIGGGRRSSGRRRENRGAIGGAEGGGVCAPSQKICEFFISEWCILGELFLRFMCHENDSDLRYSEVLLMGK